MKNFKHWGLRVREIPECNYKALWVDLKTTRLDSQPMELPPELSEFYDIAINTKCNLACSFCYTEASSKGVNHPGIVATWKAWMESYKDHNNGFGTKTFKPFQVAIGSTGEPTIHPEFCNLLEAIYNSSVIPSYTTNGLVLSAYKDEENPNYALANKILKYTARYCGGVAVSITSENQKFYDKAIEGLIEFGECKINTHHIISDKKSVDDFIAFALKYVVTDGENKTSKIHSHLLLPLMAHGRSKDGSEPGIFEYLISKCSEYLIENISFGANFADDLLNNRDIINVWMYPPEYMSKNVILGNGEVIFTKNSFNLTPCKTLKFF